MVQIGGEKDDRQNEEVLNSNSYSNDSEEKKIEEAVAVTVIDPEQEQETDSMEMNVEHENEPDSFSQTPATVFQIRLQQPDVYSLYKMDFPQVCRNFRFAYHSFLNFDFVFTNSLILLILYHNAANVIYTFFSAVAWCGKLNAIACASEACISDPRLV